MSKFFKVKKASYEMTVKIPAEEYTEILQLLWNNMNWDDEMKQSLFPKLIDFVNSVGYDEIESPKNLLNRYINNADIISREDDFQPGDPKYDEYEGNWEEFCSNEALLFNDKYACMQF